MSGEISEKIKTTASFLSALSDTVLTKTVLRHFWCCLAIYVFSDSVITLTHHLHPPDPLPHVCVAELSHDCFRWVVTASRVPSHYLKQLWLIISHPREETSLKEIAKLKKCTLQIIIILPSDKTLSYDRNHQHCSDHYIWWTIWPQGRLPMNL